MTEEEIIFLQKVRSMCAENPRLLGAMIQSATDGIDEQIKIANERAADFEVIAALMKALVNEKRLTQKTKAYYNNTINIKIEKWKNKTALNWEDNDK